MDVRPGPSNWRNSVRLKNVTKNVYGSIIRFIYTNVIRGSTQLAQWISSERLVKVCRQKLDISTMIKKKLCLKSRNEAPGRDPNRPGTTSSPPIPHWRKNMVAKWNPASMSSEGISNRLGILKARSQVVKGVAEVYSTTHRSIWTENRGTNTIEAFGPASS